MADIDKSLPNVKTSIEVDPQEEIEIEQEKVVEAQDPGVEVTPNEDGSVEVNFEGPFWSSFVTLGAPWRHLGCPGPQKR